MAHEEPELPLAVRLRPYRHIACITGQVLMQGTQAPVRLALNHVQYIVVSVALVYVGRWQTVLSQNEVDVRPLLLGEKSRTFPYRSDALGWLHGDECSQALWGGRGSRSTQRPRRTAGPHDRRRLRRSGR